MAKGGWFKALGAAALLAAGVLSGCGGSGGSASTPATAQGRVAVALTDAPGDFLKYEVNVQAIGLAKADGTTVETLPVNTRIDFATLTELAEFVSAAVLPRGEYTAATLYLDYSDADIEVEVGGVATKVDTILDPEGNPLPTPLPVKVELPRPLPVAPGTPSHLTLDFNLAATNHVDPSQSPLVLTVEPLLSAELSSDVSKLHRVRGPLQSLDEAQASFQIALRPFQSERDLGLVTVKTDGSTEFEVNGGTAKGSDGFALLAVLYAKEPQTRVVAVGELDSANEVLTAWKVLAAPNAPDKGLDMVRGTVIKRSGDVLTVRGGGAGCRETSSTVRGDIAVTVSDRTEVVRQDGGSEGLGKDAVSVGQRVIVFGTAGGASSDLITLDATRIQLLPTSLSGIYKGRNEAGFAVVSLRRIDEQPVSLFDFTGTGKTSAEDANPDAYGVSTGKLPLVDLKPDDPVRMLGYASAFGQAPPAFEAQSVVGLAGVAAKMRVDWAPASGAALAFPAEGGISLSLAGAGRVHHVYRGGVATELALAPAPQIMPGTTRRGAFTILDRPSAGQGKGPGAGGATKPGMGGGAGPATIGGVASGMGGGTGPGMGGGTGQGMSRGKQGMAGGMPMSSYSDFVPFQQDLADRIGSRDAKVVSLSAEGAFDETTQTLTADRIFITLQ